MVAGLVATAAMSLFMASARRLLPRRERYPLPPRSITDHVLGRARPCREDAPIGETSAYLAHFLFGAACGALYGVLPRRNAPPTNGVAYALLIWLGSYLGWVPAISALPPATEQPPNHNILMLAAHVAWGAVLQASYQHCIIKPIDERHPSPPFSHASYYCGPHIWADAPEPTGCDPFPYA